MTARPIFRKIVITTIVTSFILGIWGYTAPFAYAQDSRNNDGVNATAVNQPTVRSSPFDPEEPNDALFVVDDASGLDTGCSFRSDGPLVFEIEVTRYIGDLQKLKDNKLLGEKAMLRMPAFDVDSAGGGEVNPEFDRVTFNGETIKGEFLEGQNETWIMNSFEVPIELVKFPEAAGINGNKPTPAKNIIKIEIDTANTTEAWCTAIDWAELRIEVVRPVLTVHGIFSDRTTWTKTGAFNWQTTIEELGIPYASIDMHTGLGLDSIQNNAGNIASEVQKLKAEWGVDRINIVSHSKGGLDSRHYAEANDSIEKIIQIGTPNGGSPLADAIQIGSVLLLRKIPGLSTLINLAAPAGVQLTVAHMTIYNLFHGANPKTEYITLAGDYRFGGLGVLDTMTEALLLGRNDVIVPVWSVQTLGYAKNLPPLETTDSQTGARHFAFSGNPEAQTSSEAVYDRVKSFIETKGKQTPSVVAAVAEGTETDIQSFTIADIVAQGNTNLHFTIVDAQQPIAFSLHYGAGNLDMALISPSGQRIDPATAQNNPAIQFTNMEEIDGLRFETYSLQSPEIGQWTLEVTGSSVTNTTEPYIATTSLTGSTIKLQSQLDQSAYNKGNTIVVQATLIEGNNPIKEATVQAEIAAPDETTTLISLLDDGASPDATAGDGIYSGGFVSTQSSLHRIVVSAEKSSAPAFNRNELLIAFVSDSASTLNKTFSDFGDDIDGDGLFEDLVVNVGITATSPVTYRALGELADSSGNLIATTSVETALAAGSQSVVLRFSGAQIFQHRVDGPYTLQLIRLAEDNDFTVLPLDELQNAYTTAAYRYIDFRDNAVAIPGTGNDKGVDTDANGFFDLLEITLDVIVENPGFYQWSARLVDQNGTELGVLASSGALAAGFNTITFQFDGEAIGRNGVNGPYLLSDMLIFGANDSAVIIQAYTTQPYPFEQFERLIAPDLVVQEIIATKDSIEVVIKNQGTGAVPPEHDFWVDVYINPATPPTAVNDVWDFMGNEGIVWGVVAPAVPMQPGATLRLSIGDTYYWPSLSNVPSTIPIGALIYAQVDSANTESSYGGVLENHEMEGGAYNNILGPVLSKATVSSPHNEKLYLPVVTSPGLSSATKSAAAAPAESVSSEEILPVRPQVNKE